jgi:hypothetical protein
MSKDNYDNLNEFLHIFDKNPQKYSKTLANKIIENPISFFNMPIYMFDKLLDVDIARIIIERPTLVKWLKKYLYKLSDDIKKTILDKQPELNTILEFYKKKLKYIKVFEDFHNNTIVDKIKNSDINDITDKDVEMFLEYVGTSGDSIFEYDEILEHLIKHVHYIQKQPNPITLYRILSSENIDEIDTSDLGDHYTIDPMYIDDHFLEDIGIDYDSPMFLYEIETDKSNIDLESTLLTNSVWVVENEITLFPESEVKIISIKPYYEDGEL